MNNSICKTNLNIRGVGFFAGFSEEQYRRVLKNSYIKKISKDEIVFVKGDDAKNLYIILNGTMKLYNQKYCGQEVVHNLFTNGDFFGEISILHGKEYNFTAQATRNSQLLCIPGDALKMIMLEDNDLSNLMISIILNNQKKLEDQITNLSFMNATQRIGWYILNNIEKSIRLHSKFFLQHEKSLIATYLGMKPETFSRSIKKLRIVDVYVNGAEVTVNNFELLKEFCHAKYN